MPEFYEQLTPYPRGTAYQFGAWQKQEKFVWEQIVPQLDVEDKTFMYPYYASARLQQVVETRAADTGELPRLNFALPTFVEAKTERRGLKTDIPDAINDAQHVPDWARREVALDEQRKALKRELEVDTKALLLSAASDSARYHVPTVKWDAVSGTPIPQKDWYTCVRGLTNKIGRLPSFAVIPTAIADVMVGMDAVLQLRKYTDPNLLVSGGLPPKIWDVPVIVADGFVDSAKAGQAENLAAVYSEDNIYFVYADFNIARNQTAVTFAALWRWMKWGTPLAAKVWRPGDLDIEKTWVATEMHTALTEVCSSCVFVMKDVLT